MSLLLASLDSCFHRVKEVGSDILLLLMSNHHHSVSASCRASVVGYTIETIPLTHRVRITEYFFKKSHEPFG